MLTNLNLLLHPMNLLFNQEIAKGYTSTAQIARVLTENRVKQNSFCPCCGNVYLNDFENNRPVADFYCDNCKEEFELKSKNGLFSNTITDGAYATMIERINSNQNPHFFFLTYSKELSVNNFLLIPNHFFPQTSFKSGNHYQKMQEGQDGLDVILTYRMCLRVVRFLLSEINKKLINKPY